MPTTKRPRSLSGWPRWLWLPVAVGGAAAGAAAAWLSGTGDGSAHLNPKEEHLFPFHQDEYTFGSGSCSAPGGWVDPINVVFVGPEAWDVLVKEHAARPDHGGWGNHSGGQQYFWDHGECQPVEGDGRNDQSANGGSSQSRYHMRYNQGDIDGYADSIPPCTSAPAASTRSRPSTTRTADWRHATQAFLITIFYPGHAVDSNNDEPPGGLILGRTEGSLAVDELAGFHPNLGFSEWQNVKRFKQCDQEDAWSDGWVRFIGMGSPGGGGGGGKGGGFW